MKIIIELETEDTPMNKAFQIVHSVTYTIQDRLEKVKSMSVVIEEE